MGKRAMRFVIAAAVVAALGPSAAVAQQHRPMPAFGVVSSGGALVRSEALSSSRRWLLVYVAADTVPGDRLLRAIDTWGVDTARVVVLTSGDVASIAGRIRPLMPASSGSVAVYSDPDGSAARALGFTSAPALAGVFDGAIDWTLQGVLNDPAMVEPVIRSWLLQQ
jgi:hypothetical protein